MAPTAKRIKRAVSDELARRVNRHAMLEIAAEQIASARESGDTTRAGYWRRLWNRTYESERARTAARK